MYHSKYREDSVYKVQRSLFFILEIEGICLIIKILDLELGYFEHESTSYFDLILF
jgi:hypothetical protein